jgi:hypothetical protein
MKKIITVIGVIAAFAVVLSSCTKEGGLLKTEDAKEMLQFKDHDELSATLSLVSNMSENERKQWENSQNFKSLGRISDEIYAKANPENFKSMEDFYSFVEKNSAYLQLEEDKDGQILNTKLYFTALRYIVGKDQFYQVGDIVSKVFEQGVASTHIDNIGELKNLDEKRFELSRKQEVSSNISTYSFDDCFERRPATKDLANDAGLDHTVRRDNGNQRTLMRITLHSYRTAVLPGGVNTVPAAAVEVEFHVRPYKKTLGIWYFCSRTITASACVVVDYLVPNNPAWQRFPWKDEVTSKSDSHYTKFSGIYQLYIGHDASGSRFHFGGFRCSAYTASTGTVTLNENTHILPC